MKGMYITTCEIYNIDMYIYKEFQKSIKNKAQAYVYRFLYQESLAYIFNFDVKHSFV